MNWLDKRVDAFIRRVRDDPRVRRIPIGPVNDPTYWRYFVIRRNRYLNIYLHCFRHSDGEDLHDHRMSNISVILQGSYMEERFDTPPVAGQPLPARTLWNVIVRMRPLFRRARTPHRVVLFTDVEGVPDHVWSLFIGFPQWRNWGFWKEYNTVACWFPHECFVTSSDPEAIGYGQNRESVS